MRGLIKTTILISAAIIGGGAAGETNNGDVEVLTKQAKVKTKTFATTLKQALLSAVQSGGFEHGVKVCKDQAPDIAAQLSTDGWQVMRTSLKTRNSDNEPSSWEYDMLVAFDQQFKAGKPSSSLTAASLNESQFRYMQAIPTGQMCLSCHGQNVDPKLYESIKEAYPNDAAIGFTLNDLRGAFIVTKSLNN